MGIIIRGMTNVLRNPLRLILVVVLLGASLMFVAAMVSLNASAQQQLASVHQQVGTAITINYAENDAGQFGGSFGRNFGGGNAGSTGSNSNTSNAGGNGGNTPGTAPATGGTGGAGTSGTRGSSPPAGGFGQVTSTPIPNSVVKQVTSVANISSAEETVRQTDSDGVLKTSSFTTPDGRSIALPATIYGVSNGATHFTLGSGSTPTIVAGRGFQDSDATANVAMMSKSLASSNNMKIGSTFKLKSTTFTIVALYTTTDQFSASTITIPLAVAQTIYAVKGVDSITAYATSYETVESAATKLKSVLGSKYDVVTSDSLYTSTFSALNVAQNSIYLALVVSIAVAVIVIIFAVFIIVRERTIEIGTMKAIGASHWQVIRQFWGEVLAMSGLGAIIGILLLAILGPTISQKFDVTTAASTTTATTGFGGPGGGRGFGGGGLFARSAQAAKISNVHLASATLNVQTLLIIVGLGIGLAVVTSVIPAWYVSRIKPAVVLRKG